MIELDGLSYAEVAEVLELAPQTVANHMSLALRDLRESLGDLREPEADATPRRRGRDHDG